MDKTITRKSVDGQGNAVEETRTYGYNEVQHREFIKKLVIKKNGVVEYTSR